MKSVHKFWIFLWLFGLGHSSIAIDCRTKLAEEHLRLASRNRIPSELFNDDAKAAIDQLAPFNEIFELDLARVVVGEALLTVAKEAGLSPEIGLLLPPSSHEQKIFDTAYEFFVALVQMARSQNEEDQKAFAKFAVHGEYDDREILRDCLSDLSPHLLTSEPLVRALKLELNNRYGRFTAYLKWITGPPLGVLEPRTLSWRTFPVKWGDETKFHSLTHARAVVPSLTEVGRTLLENTQIAPVQRRTFLIRNIRLFTLDELERFIGELDFTDEDTDEERAHIQAEIDALKEYKKLHELIENWLEEMNETRDRIRAASTNLDSPTAKRIGSEKNSRALAEVSNLVTALKAVKGLYLDQSPNPPLLSDADGISQVATALRKGQINAEQIEALIDEGNARTADSDLSIVIADKIADSIGQLSHIKDLIDALDLLFSISDETDLISERRVSLVTSLLDRIAQHPVRVYSVEKIRDWQAEVMQLLEAFFSDNEAEVPVEMAMELVSAMNQVGANQNEKFSTESEAEQWLADQERSKEAATRSLSRATGFVTDFRNQLSNDLEPSLTPPETENTPPPQLTEEEVVLLQLYVRLHRTKRFRNALTAALGAEMRVGGGANTSTQAVITRLLDGDPKLNITPPEYEALTQIVTALTNEETGAELQRAATLVPPRGWGWIRWTTRPFETVVFPSIDTEADPKISTDDFVNFLRSIKTGSPALPYFAIEALRSGWLTYGNASDILKRKNELPLSVVEALKEVANRKSWTQP